MSCRQAAERFGVSASSAIRWQQRVRTTGTIEPRTQGGDRRSKRIEAHSQVILGLVAETPDITLVGIRARLADRAYGSGLARSGGSSIATGSRAKKRLPTRRSRTALIS
jgi:transposase